MVQEVLKEDITENSNTITNNIDYSEELFQKCSKLGLLKKKTKPWRMTIMLHNASMGRVPLL